MKVKLLNMRWHVDGVKYEHMSDKQKDYLNSVFKRYKSIKLKTNKNT